MRKIVIIACLLVTVGVTNSFAQLKANKFGYVNSLEILSLMPEIKPADAQLEKYAGELEMLYQGMLTEYQKAIGEFQEQEKMMTDASKELKIKEIQDLETRIGEFQQSTQEKISKKREALYAPILEKADKAIKSVAKENGYTYIFDSSSGSLLFAEESDNIISLVKTKLGI